MPGHVAHSRVENLKTVRLLLMQHVTDIERTMLYCPDMSPEKQELRRACTAVQKAIVYVEQDIRTLETL